MRSDQMPTLLSLLLFVTHSSLASFTFETRRYVASVSLACSIEDLFTNPIHQVRQLTAYPISHKSDWPLRRPRLAALPCSSPPELIQARPQRHPKVCTSSCCRRTPRRHAHSHCWLCRVIDCLLRSPRLHLGLSDVEPTNTPEIAARDRCRLLPGAQRLGAYKTGPDSSARTDVLLQRHRRHEIVGC